MFRVKTKYVSIVKEKLMLTQNTTIHTKHDISVNIFMYIYVKTRKVRARIFLKKNNSTRVTRLSDIVYRYTLARVKLGCSNQAWVLGFDSSNRAWLGLEYPNLTRVFELFGLSSDKRQLTCNVKKRWTLRTTTVNCKSSTPPPV